MASMPWAAQSFAFSIMAVKSGPFGETSSMDVIIWPAAIFWPSFDFCSRGMMRVLVLSDKRERRKSKGCDYRNK